MMIDIPQSVQDYYNRKGISTAVDLILSQDEKYLPEDLEWKDLKSFHKSVLAALTVRTDRAILLMDAWDAIWKPALANCGIEKEVLMSEMDKSARPSVSFFKEQESLDKQYRDPRYPDNDDVWIYTSIWYEGPDSGFYLSLASFDENGESTLEDDFDLGKLWIANNKMWKDTEFDGFFSTKKNTFKVDRNSSQVDSKKMQVAATDGLQRLLKSTR